MDPRAEALARTLDLRPHPEGGAYREVYRSPVTVAAHGGTRPAATAIYFLLTAGEFSHWHRVASDELWHFYEGDPLEIACLSGDGTTIERHTLGPPGAGHTPLRWVPAGRWQTARCLGAYSLVGCTVAPGFEFDDFALLRDTSEAELLLRRHPDIARFL